MLPEDTFKKENMTRVSDSRSLKSFYFSLRYLEVGGFALNPTRGSQQWSTLWLALWNLLDEWLMPSGKCPRFTITKTMALDTEQGSLGFHTDRRSGWCFLLNPKCWLTIHAASLNTEMRTKDILNLHCLKKKIIKKRLFLFPQCPLCWKSISFLFMDLNMFWHRSSSCSHIELMPHWAGKHFQWKVCMNACVCAFQNSHSRVAT